jgi:hypothetical protein
MGKRLLEQALGALGKLGPSRGENGRCVTPHLEAMHEREKTPASLRLAKQQLDEGLNQSA